MKLLVSDHPAAKADTLKLKLAAALANVQIEVVVCPPKEIRSKSAFGTLPILETPHGTIGKSGAIFDFLLADSPLVKGADAFQTAEIANWGEYVSSDFGTVCQVSSFPFIGVEKYEKLSGAAFMEVAKRLGGEVAGVLSRIVERGLQSKTFLVGERLSAADVHLFCALLQPMQFFVDSKKQKNLKNTVRWFNTVLADEKVAAVVGDFKFCAKPPSYQAAAAAKGKAAGAGAGAASASSSAAAGGNKKVLSSGVEIQELFKRSRVRVKEVLHAEDGGKSRIGTSITVCGWARTVRAQSKLAFIELTDGSCFESIQVVCTADAKGFEEVGKSGGAGASFRVEGTVVESPAKGQVIEVKATHVKVLGTIDQTDYPLKKTKHAHSKEFLRDIAHLRPRTNLIGAVARVRNALAFATHLFFNERGFQYVHTPIVTGADCEGAGEMFQVTTMLPEDKTKDVPRVDAKDPRIGKDPSIKAGDIDYHKDFFGKPAYLTVSGQLNVECYASALSDVYTFGPTFRAENSHTSRHLAEFWMIEPEICFADLDDDMDLAEDYVKFCIKYVLDHCMSDMKFFDQRVEKGLLDRLNNVSENPFKRLKYTEAIEILNQPEHLKKGKFKEKPDWGIDLGSEHERYLTEKVFKKPVILIDYPADIKAFYMRQNEPDEQGRRTVQAMDILVPKIGELVGGSAREERLDLLEKRLHELNLDPKDFDWYCDLRRFGSVPHAGFGLGFERLVLFITGVENIRDVIPFPRAPNQISY